MPLKNGKTTASVQSILIGSVIPPGVIQAFGGGTVPEGWLLCDGSTVSRTAFVSLFAAVGTAHGTGDGSTTFHLPDLRGRFLRGADNMGTGAAGRDPDAAGRTAANAGGATGNTVGSVQADSVQGHGHDFAVGNTSSGFGHLAASNQLAKADGAGGQYLNSVNGGTKDDIRNPVTLSGFGTIKTSTETRGQNANAAYIIKV